MDSRKPLTEAEIEELKRISADYDKHGVEWKEAMFALNALPRLLSLLTPPPDAAVREAVESVRSETVSATFRMRKKKRVPMVLVELDSLNTILRAVQAPRLTGEQVEAVKNINRKTESRQCICGDGYLCARCEILGELRAAFPDLFTGEVTSKSGFEGLVGMTFTKSEGSDDE